MDDKLIHPGAAFSMADVRDSADFTTTKWPLVRRAAGDPSALAELLRLYWPPMYAYVRCMGFSREDAADVVQDFMLERMIDGSFVQGADHERGRFRMLIKTSLKNFVVDRVRHRATSRRAPQAGVLLTLTGLDEVEPRANEDPSAAFDRQWISTLLQAACTQVQADCESQGLTSHWRAFERAIVLPLLGRIAQTPLADLVAELGEESATSLGSKIQTVRRKFKRKLRSLIEDTILDPRDADLEAEQLRSLMML